MEGHEDGPRGEINYTEEELFSQARVEMELDSENRPMFLIRLHKLPYKKVQTSTINLEYGYRRDLKTKTEFLSQDFVVDVQRGYTYNLGQSVEQSTFGYRYNSDESSESEQSDESEGSDDSDNLQDNFELEPGDDDEDEEGDIIDDDPWNIGQYTELSGECYSPFVSPRHCRIERDQESDEVSIQDWNSKHGTFVNGFRLAPMEKVTLKDGDVISVGISHLDSKCNLEVGKFWVFKFKELAVDEFNRCLDMRSQAIGNLVILSNIFKYLDFYHLKIVRKVCKVWNEAAITQFKNRSLISFIIKLIDSWDTDFASKSAMFKAFSSQKLKISEQAIGDELTPVEVECFQQFLKDFSSRILEIVIDFGCYLKPLDNSRLILLKMVLRECQNIRHVTVYDDISQVLPELEVNESVKSLKFDCFRWTRGFSNLHKPFPCLEEISIDSAHITAEFLKFFSTASNREKCKENFQKLKTLRLFEAVEDLGKFPIDLKMLELTEVKFRKSVAAAVSSFSGSLLSLNYLEVDLKSKVYFPEMKLLKKLKINIRRSKKCKIKELVFRWGKASEENFPNLKIIEIVALSRREFQNGELFLETFLSEENMRHFPKLETALVTLGDLRKYVVGGQIS